MGPAVIETDLRSQLFEGSLRLRRERLARNFAMLGFGRPAVFGRSQFEPGDEFLIEVSDDQLAHGCVIAMISALPMIGPSACQADNDALCHNIIEIATYHHREDGRAAAPLQQWDDYAPSF